MSRVELMFGFKGKAGRAIPLADWRSFLADEVTPRFPDGLTVLQGYGQWRNAAGKIVREPMRQLIVLYPPAGDADARIEAIRAAFKKRFEAESVLRIDSAACASF